jgi:hypothetical protein
VAGKQFPKLPHLYQCRVGIISEVRFSAPGKLPELWVVYNQELEVQRLHEKVFSLEQTRVPTDA